LQLERLEPIEPQALRHRIVSVLKRLIISGELQPGDRVLEADLAERLGVSRGPVREAFHQLEQEGLLVSSPHRGTFVATLPEDEIEEIYFLRAHLEGYAAKRVAAERRDEALPLLESLVQQMRSAAAAGDLPRLADLDLQFHETMLRLSGYEHLLRLWRSMDGLIRARTYVAIGEPSRASLVEYTPTSHLPIVEAIRSGDPARAEQSVHQHILEVKDLIERGAPPDSSDGQPAAGPGGEASA
jgi:DNA-binding GntR family transcriptional regulator